MISNDRLDNLVIKKSFWRLKNTTHYKQRQNNNMISSLNIIICILYTHVINHNNINVTQSTYKTDEPTTLYTILYSREIVYEHTLITFEFRVIMGVVVMSDLCEYDISYLSS